MAFTPKTWLDRPFAPNSGETPAQYEARLAAYAVENPSLVTAVDAAALIDMEERLSAYTDDVATALSGETTFGYEGLGTARNSASSSVKFASAWECTASGVLRYIEVDLSGGGSAGSGSQVVKTQVHSDNGASAGSNLPLNLLAESTEQTVAYADGRPASKVRIELVDPPTVTEGDIVWLGYHFGNTLGVARYGYSGQSGQRYVYVSDTYSNGASSTFGTPTVVNSQVLALAGVIEPIDQTQAIADLQDDVTALQAGTVAIDSRLDALELGGGGGGGGIITSVVSTDPLAAGELEWGAWVDTEDSGGVFVAASSRAVGGAGTILIQDSADGVTGTYRAQITAGSISGGHVANALALTGQRYFRVGYGNGAGSLTGFELTQGYSVTE